MRIYLVRIWKMRHDYINMSIYTYHFLHKSLLHIPYRLIFRYFFNFCFFLKVLPPRFSELVDKFSEFLHGFSDSPSPLFL